MGVGSPFVCVKALGGIQCYVAGTECRHGSPGVNRPGTTFRLDRPGGHVRFVAVAYGH